MKVLKRVKIFISPAGALIAVICFFLPWLEISCINRKISGATIGGITWGIFGLSLIILFSFSYFTYFKSVKKSKPFILASALGGLILMAVLIFKFQQQLEVKYPGRSLNDLGIHFRFGVLGTIAGLITALIGTFFLSDSPAGAKINNEIEKTFHEDLPAGSVETGSKIDDESN